MAKMKTTPTSYKEAHAVLGNKTSVKLGNNTYLERRLSGAIAVRLHNTNIVVFDEDGETITVSSGGWQSSTTKDRINQFIPFGRVYQKNYGWFFEFGGKSVPFFDGMNITAVAKPPITPTKSKETVVDQGAEANCYDALVTLVKWAKQNAHKNPYGVPEIEKALKVIAHIRGMKEWMDAVDKL